MDTITIRTEIGDHEVAVFHRRGNWAVTPALWADPDDPNTFALTYAPNGAQIPDLGGTFHDVVVSIDCLCAHGFELITEDEIFDPSIRPRLVEAIANAAAARPGKMVA